MIVINNLILNKIKELTLKDNKTLVERALKTSEECGELAQATLSYEKVNGTEYKELTQENVIEEAVDTLLCTISMMYHVDSTFNEDKLNSIINEKLLKWESKLTK